jgi:hypothetical protein
MVQRARWRKKARGRRRNKGNYHKGDNRERHRTKTNFTGLSN